MLYPATLEGRDWPVYFESANAVPLLLNRELQVVGQITPPPIRLALQPDNTFWISPDELLMLVMERSDHVIYRYQLSSGRLVDALAEIATQLVERGWASPRGLGLSGCSYGGFLSAHSAVRHPGLWAATNPTRPSIPSAPCILNRRCRLPRISPITSSAYRCTGALPIRIRTALSIPCSRPCAVSALAN